MSLVTSLPGVQSQLIPGFLVKALTVRFLFLRQCVSSVEGLVILLEIVWQVAAEPHSKTARILKSALSLIPETTATVILHRYLIV